MRIPIEVHCEALPTKPDLLTVYEEAVDRLGEEHAYLLESQGGPEVDGRNSFVGIGQVLRVAAWGDTICVTGVNAQVVAAAQEMLLRAGQSEGMRRDQDHTLWIPHPEALWPILIKFRDAFECTDPAAVHFLTHLGYEAAQYFENVYRDRRHVAQVPDVSITLFSESIHVDGGGQAQRICLRSPLWSAPLGSPGAAEARSPGPGEGSEALAPTSGRDGEGGHVDADDYKEAVEECLEDIRAGEIYQVQIGHGAPVPTPSSPTELYRALRSANPSPYMYLTSINHHLCVGASPELHVRVSDGTAMMRPIAGTARRAGDEAVDQQRRLDLATDPKEIAEHIMLVDLCRNDLSRVCEPGSVEVPSLMSVDDYSHVMHLVSTVSGALRGEVDGWDTIPATFPAGTMTGAPKLRSMEIIRQREWSPRGMYAGAVGLLSLDGSSVNLALCIRTIFRDPEGRCSTRASAGVVIASTPDEEWAETLSKMRAAHMVGARAAGRR